jgi:hypothetical protein
MGYGFETDMSGMNFVNALVLVPLLTSLSAKQPLDTRTALCRKGGENATSRRKELLLLAK